MEQVQPLHVHVKVDHYIHGCPPSGPEIRAALEALLHGDASYPAETDKFG